MHIERVCSSCFDDQDISAWIRDVNGPKKCNACGKCDSPTCEFSELCKYIQSCLMNYWGFAVEQLPYESAEGGYQGTTWNTEEILFDEVELTLPRDSNSILYAALLDGLPDETWCDSDWLTLNDDVALKTSWDQFCYTIKHKRRFFFHSEGTDDRDSFTPASLLATIANISLDLNLIHEIASDTMLWRARPDLSSKIGVTSSDFGPPPEQLALQSNRMNPAGIPMLYLSSTSKIALIETQSPRALVGKWKNVRPLRVFDLRCLPDIPGYFSDKDRTYRLALKFLHRFKNDIMIPVERDQRVHVNYLPSQVVTEFFRDFEFEGGKLDGIAYGSTVHTKGWNVVLFANQSDLGLVQPEWGPLPIPWLQFLGSKLIHL